MTFIRKAATSVPARKCLQKVIGALLMCADDNEDCARVDDKEVECAVNTGEDLVKVIRWWLFCRK